MTKQSDYDERQKKKKLVRVKVWVPDSKTQIVKDCAKKLREESKNV